MLSNKETFSKINQIFEELKVEGIITNNPFSLRYISGFTGGEGFLLLTKNKNYLLTDSRYTIMAKEEAKGFKVIEIKKAYTEHLNSLFEQESIRYIGFEGNHLTYDTYVRMHEKLNVEEMVSVGLRLELLRMIKSADEIEKLRKAEHIGDIAFGRILEVIKPGMTELEVAAHLEYYMKMSGAQGLSFDTIAASGLNSAKPHAIPGTKKLENGDFLTMDFGCIYDGYCSDMTRTIVVGKASYEQKKVYNTVLEAQKRALEAVHAGVKGCEVDKIARDYIDCAGYAGCFGHGLGHSVGLYIHEEPRFSPKEERIIEENVIMTVEPGIYIEDFGGVRIEDMIVVKEGGYENLTHSPKELIEI